MEMIKIYEGNLVNARELHEFLEVKTPFNKWIKRMLEYGFTENVDYLTMDKKVHRQILKEFHLTISCAKEISMIQRTEKGKQARLYFIEAEQTLSEIKKNKRLESFLKLETTKDKLLKNIASMGGGKQDFIQIDFEARKIFFNGDPVSDDELHIALMKARDFATEMTNLNFNNFEGLDDVEADHKRNHQDVRDLLQENTGKVPEDLPPQKNVKKLGE